MYAGKIVESGCRRGDAAPPQAPVHRGPADLDPVAGRPRPAAQRDQGHRPQPVPPAQGLQVRAPLPVSASSRARPTIRRSRRSAPTVSVRCWLHVPDRIRRDARPPRPATVAARAPGRIRPAQRQPVPSAAVASATTGSVASAEWPTPAGLASPTAAPDHRTGAAGDRASTGSTRILVRIEDLRKYFPIFGGILRHKIGDVRAVDGVTLRDPAGRGRSASWASPAAARRPSAGRCCCSRSPRPGRSSSTART